MQLPDAIDRLRPSTVQIALRSLASPRETAVIGSGFIVNNDGHVVTAKHVTDALRPGQELVVQAAGKDLDTAEITVRANFVGTEATVVGISELHDLALLHVPVLPAMSPGFIKIGDVDLSPEPKPVRIANRKLREGTGIAVSGYPLASPSLVTNAGVLACTFAPDEPEAETVDAVRHLGDFTANPGNSGGPVYTIAEAQVIGVCVAGKLTHVWGAAGKVAANLTVIVTAEDLLTFLSEHDVSLPQVVPPARKRKE